MLESYGVEVPKPLKKELTDNFAIIDMNEESEVKFTVQQCPSMKDLSSPSILVSTSVDLNYLKKTITKLKKFLHPVWEYKNVWISLHNNKFYRLYFNVIFEECHFMLHLQGMQCFLASIEETIKRLLWIFRSGNANYSEISLNRKVKFDILQNCKLRDSIQQVIGCLVGSESEEEFLGFKGLVSLVNVSSTKKLIGLICNVCELRKLNGCLADERFEKLKNISKNTV